MQDQNMQAAQVEEANKTDSASKKRAQHGATRYTGIVLAGNHPANKVEVAELRLDGPTSADVAACVTSGAANGALPHPIVSKGPGYDGVPDSTNPKEKFQPNAEDVENFAKNNPELTLTPKLSPAPQPAMQSAPKNTPTPMPGR